MENTNNPKKTQNQLAKDLGSLDSKIDSHRDKLKTDTS